jgi:hypothetical protein
MGRIKHIILSCLILLFAEKIFAIGDTLLHLQLIKEINGNFKNFYADNLNNIFTLNQDNQLKKLDRNGDSVAVFNDVRKYGELYSLDVSNPLKLMLYYRDFATILTLDRFLNVLNTIDLRQSNILQARAVAQSYDNDYWVFDEVESKLKKIDDNGVVLLETPDFRQLFNDSFVPVKIIDEAGLLYLYDESKGWLVFDYYGAFKQAIQLPGWKDVQVNGKILSGRTDNIIHYYNPALITTKDVVLDVNGEPVIKCIRSSVNIYLLHKTNLAFYSF